MTKIATGTSYPPKPGCMPGFSLVEMLVGIGMVAVLAAILIMGLGSLRQSMDRTSCVNNLRQVNAAIHMYTADHNGRLPGPNRGNVVFATYSYRYGAPETSRLTLWDHLMPYLELPEPPAGQRLFAEVGICPAAALHPEDDAWMAESKFYSVNIWRSAALPERYPNTEGFPSNLAPFGTDTGSGESRVISHSTLRVEQVLHPEQFAIMMDAPGNSGGNGWHRGSPPTYSHNGSFNVLYLDGRVSTVRP